MQNPIDSKSYLCNAFILMLMKQPYGYVTSLYTTHPLHYVLLSPATNFTTIYSNQNSKK